MMIRQILLYSGFVLSCCCFGLPGVSADWPEFRGPSGQGLSRESDLPLHWSETQNIRWSTELPGLGWSSPVVVGDRVFLTSAIEQQPTHQILTAFCLDANSGKILWNQELFSQQGKVQIHKKNSHASPTPIVENNRVYLHFGPHGTACVSARDGKLLWKTKLNYKPTHGNGGSPALFDDLLIICCDGSDQQFVVALDTETGDERWRTPRATDPERGFSFSTPLIIHVQGEAQAICPGSDAVFAYEPKTGREIWHVRYPGGYSVVPRPVYAGGLVFVCTGYNRPNLLAIDPTGTGDVTETHLRWQIDRAVPHNPSPLALGNELYFVSDSGIASCVDLKSGTLHWRERLGGKFSASPIAAGQRIYLQNEAGKVHVIEAGTTFREITANEWATDERTYASFAVAGKDLILRSEARVLRVTNR